MSIGRIVTGLWRNSAETSDRSTDPKLKTQYYKTSKAKMLETITSVINKKLPGWRVTHVDEERGEMLAEKKGIRQNQIVITVYQVEPRKCAVDVVSAYKEGFGDLGLSYFKVIKFFEVLNNEMKAEQKV